MDLGIVLQILGVLMLGVASFLDFGFRHRMAAAGHKRALLQAGSFDYSEYHKARKEHGWPAWPVYVMWSLAILGIALLIVGFFTYFGASPRHR